MSIKDLVLGFRREANKIDSSQSQKLPVPTIIAYLNEGQLQLMRTRYGSNNNYRATLESIQKRIDEWQRLITPHHIIDGTAKEDSLLYSFDLPFKEGYCFLLRTSFILSKDNCKDQRTAQTFLTQSDDLNINLDNPNSNSNFDWREVNYRLAKDQILAYTDPTFSFSIDKADIDFLRYPKLMDISGYTHFNGSASADVDCELPDFLQPEIVNEAVLLFKAALGHPDVNTAAMKKAIEE